MLTLLTRTYPALLQPCGFSCLAVHPARGGTGNLPSGLRELRAARPATASPWPAPRWRSRARRGAPAAHGDEDSPLQRGQCCPGATPPQPSSSLTPRKQGGPRGVSITPSLENSTALKGHPGRKAHVFAQTAAGGAEPRNWHRPGRLGPAPPRASFPCSRPTPSAGSAHLTELRSGDRHGHDDSCRRPGRPLRSPHPLALVTSPKVGRGVRNFQVRPYEFSS